MNKKISVVIPVYNNYDMLHALLTDILQHNSDVEEILLMNDAVEKTDSTIYNGLEWWSTQLPQLSMINNEENLGFLKNCNYGVECAKGDIIILVSTDVRIQVNITDMLRSVFTGNSNLMLGGIYYDRSTGWNEFINGKGQPIIFPYLEGWLLIFQKKDWLKLGGFDEIFSPNDMEDVDISTTALREGFTLRPLSYSQIRHHGAATIGYNPERQALTERNRIKFANKWKVKIP